MSRPKCPECGAYMMRIINLVTGLGYACENCLHEESVGFDDEEYFQENEKSDSREVEVKN